MSLNDTTPPPRGATAGIDWASDNHAVCVLDPDGAVIERQTVAHTAAGLRRLIDLLMSRHRVDAVGIERGDGPVIDALLATDLTIYVIPPSQVKNLRGRYGSAGNKDDRFDAYVLADTVRTDRQRLTPLVLDSESTTALRRLCRARRDLVAHRVAVANQLRAHLATAMPAAVDLFADIDSPISLRFLARSGTQDRADWLSPRRMAAWLASVGYSGRASPAVLHARLAAAPRGAAADSHHASPRAAGLYHKARILARAWLFVIWHCWQDQTAYNPRHAPGTPAPPPTRSTDGGLHRATYGRSSSMVSRRSRDRRASRRTPAGTIAARPGMRTPPVSATRVRPSGSLVAAIAMTRKRLCSQHHPGRTLPCRSARKPRRLTALTLTRSPSCHTARTRRMSGCTAAKPPSKSVRTVQTSTIGASRTRSVTRAPRTAAAITCRCRIGSSSATGQAVLMRSTPFGRGVVLDAAVT